MATTSTDPRDIEADLERERASLATTLDALSDRVSVDNLAREALGMLRSHAGTATVSLDHAVRANPIAVALIGAGVAYLLLGPKMRGSSSSKKVSDYSSGYQGSDASSSGHLSSGYQSSGQAQPSGYGSSSGYGGSSYGSSAGGSGAYLGSQSSGQSGSSGQGGYGSSSYAGSAGQGSYASSSDYGRVGYVASDNDEDHSWSREAHGLRARATEALRRIEEEAKSYYDSLRRGITGGVSSTRDFAAERASVISGFTSDLRSRLALGLDNLSPESRDRVIAARERAYGAMLQAERMGRDVWRDPTRAMEEHPLVAGAVGFALGATAAALLPSTDVENRTFGAERDRLMDEAARLVRQERERAMQIAGELGQEIKAAAQETVEAVSDTVASKASDAAHRVTDRATEEVRSATGGTSGGSGAGSSPSLAGPGDPVIG